MDASARGGLMMKFASLLKRDIEYLAVNFCLTERNSVFTKIIII